MKKLRIYLLCDYLYYTVLILAIIYAGITLFVEQPLKRDGEELKFKGIITSIKIDGNKLELVIKGKLKVLGYHYFKTKENKDLFLIKYSIGDQVLFNGTLEKPTTNRNFNLFNYQNYLKSKKIKYLYKVISYEKLNNKKKLLYKIKSRIYTQIKKSPKSKGYLYALVLGDKTKMSNEIKKSYQKNGISHLFAISGMHIGFLVLSILKILKYTSISMRKQHYILFAILISYLFLTGFSPSIFRAVVFFILLGINKVFYLYIKRINIFFITLSLLLVYESVFCL